MRTTSATRAQGTLPPGHIVIGAREVPATAVASLLGVALAAVSFWVAGGVRYDEIARYVPYEIGFVLLPGWVVYRALVAGSGWLEQIVFGWSLGYLLEILAFLTTAWLGARSVFSVYPLLVVLPTALVLVRRRRSSARARSVATRVPAGSVWIGAVLAALVLAYAAVVGFTQTPLPRDVSSVTYQEDTVFTVSLAAEALHHWPMTLPSIAGEPLNYHVFAYLHMAAIGQMTGIDLSVVVMRLYEIPLLVLFALQLILAGRRVGRAASAGIVACFLVLFLGEIDVALRSGVGEFLFRDLFFFWLVASHTFLLGLVFFVPATLVLCELIAEKEPRGGSRLPAWALLTILLVGCVGSKSYSLLVLAGALVLFQLPYLWRERTIHRPALGALGITAGIIVAANLLVFGWSSAGAVVEPFENLATTVGVAELTEYVGGLWSIEAIPDEVGAPYAIFGLLAVPLVGITLLLRYRQEPLSAGELLFLSLFVTVLPTLLLVNQPGFGQMFLVFYGVVPGTIVAARGYVLFWRRVGRASFRGAALMLALVGAALLARDVALGTSPAAGMQLTLFVVALACAVGLAAGARTPRFGRWSAVGFALGALLVLGTPLVGLARRAAGSANDPPLEWVEGLVALGLGLACLTVVGLLARRQSVRGSIAVAAVLATLLLAFLNTPLDYLPRVIGRVADGRPPYNQEHDGLTSGLYDGLRWVRDRTTPDAVLVVNNHSLYPDGRDSKYFYYSAFAERRIVLESWDYSPQTIGRGVFSLPESLSPFPRRLALSNAAVRDGDEKAMRVLARRYGATHVVVDRVHGRASPQLRRLFPTVFSNDDVDVYAVGGPGDWRCRSEQGAGLAVNFGHRRSVRDAEALRAAAENVGFRELNIQRRGCLDYAVVLTGFRDLAQARAFRRQAPGVGFEVRIECRTHPASGELNAVFGHRRTRAAAEALARRARAVGFEGLVVQQDECRDWEVDLPGLQTSAQREEFRKQAEDAGFEITFEPG